MVFLQRKDPELASDTGGVPPRDRRGGLGYGPKTRPPVFLHHLDEPKKRSFATLGFIWHSLQTNALHLRYLQEPFRLSADAVAQLTKHGEVTMDRFGSIVPRFRVAA